MSNCIPYFPLDEGETCQFALRPKKQPFRMVIVPPYCLATQTTEIFAKMFIFFADALGWPYECILEKTHRWQPQSITRIG